MFKAGIIAFAISAAAAGTTFWLKTGFDAKSADHVSTGMPSILEMARQSALERTSRSRSPGTILIRNAATAERPRWIHRTAAFPPRGCSGCSEKSPRQGARAVRLGVDHPWGDPEGDPVDGALIELRR